VVYTFANQKVSCSLEKKEFFLKLSLSINILKIPDIKIWINLKGRMGVSMLSQSLCIA